jgi:hypothetical protein
MQFVIELYKLVCGTFMNGGKLPSGGSVRARYAGWRCGASIQRLCHSAIASSRAVSRKKAFDRGGGGRVGAWRAVSNWLATTLSGPYGV